MMSAMWDYPESRATMQHCSRKSLFIENGRTATTLDVTILHPIIDHLRNKTSLSLWHALISKSRLASREDCWFESSHDEFLDPHREDQQLSCTISTSTMLLLGP